MFTKRVFLLTGLGGLIILLFSTGIAPYYLRQHALKSQFESLSEAECGVLINETNEIIARYLGGNETFHVTITDQNIQQLPPQIRSFKPSAVTGGHEVINILFDGFGDSVTAMNIYRKNGRWYILGYFGEYSNPPLQAYPKD